jgi:hypothetical protein
MVRLNIASIEIPAGIASESEPLWSYLNEESVNLVRTPVLGFNGLRIGIGNNSVWPDIAELLKQMTGRRVIESVAVAVPGRPLPIVLKQYRGEQTLFLFREDRTISGMDYPSGEQILMMVCTLNEDDPSQVLITAVPQIRTIQRKSHFIQQDGKYMMVSQPEEYPLTPLTFQVLLPSNDFLMIGAGTESGRTTSVGHSFLIKDKDGLEFETLLIIKPEVFAAPAGEMKLAIPSEQTGRNRE